MASSPAGTPGAWALLCRVLDRYYLPLMAAAALGVLVLNYRAWGQSGITPAFEDIRDVIRSGFDGARATRRGAPTAPMWGYAWLLLLTGSKPVLLVIQNALMLVSVGYYVRVLGRTGLLNAGQLSVLRLLLVVSLPWYAFHSVRWEAGFASSFMLAGTALLAEVLHGRFAVTGRLVLSAVMFGIAANFRSDTLLAPVIFAPLLLVLGRFRRPAVAAAFVWLAGTVALLVPWGMYTRHLTGRFLLTSTNGGLVSTIGFGANPGNRWGITISDGDPVVRGWLDERFPPGTSPCSAAADRYLKQRLRGMIWEHPAEYARKVGAVLRGLVTAGVYPGEFYRRLSGPHSDPNETYLALRSQALRRPLELLRDSPGNALVLVAQLGSSLLGRLVILLSYACLPFVAVCAVRRRNALLLCILAAIVYRTLLLGLFAFPDPRLATPAYPFHLVNLVVGLAMMWGWVGRRLTRPHAPRPSVSPP